MPASEAPAKPRRPWLDREHPFRMRLPVFVGAVAGCALISRAWLFHQDAVNPSRLSFRWTMHAVQNGSTPGERTQAAQLLSDAPPGSAADASAVLLIALRDPEDAVRAAAARALGQVMVHYFVATDGDDPPYRDAASLALIRLLREDGPHVRDSARDALALFVQPALPPRPQKRTTVGLSRSLVEPRLREMLDSPDTVRVLAAYRLLRGVGVPASALLPTLRRLVREAEPSGRGEALVALAGVLRDRKEPADEVLALLKDPDEGFRCDAARILASYWGGDRRVGEALTRALDAKSPSERTNAVFALARLPRVPGEAVPGLVRAMPALNVQIEGPMIRLPGRGRPGMGGGDSIGAGDIALLRVICEALRKTPPGAAREALPSLAKALPSLLRMASNPEHEPAAPVVEAIFAIGPDSPEAREAHDLLASELGSRGWVVHHISAIRLLALAAPLVTDEDAVALARCVERGADDPRSEEAARTLRKIGDRARPAAPILLASAGKALDEGLVPGDLIDLLMAVEPESAEVAELLVRVAEIASFPATDYDRKAAKLYLLTLPGRGQRLIPALRSAREAADANRRSHIDAVLLALQSGLSAQDRPDKTEGR